MPENKHNLFVYGTLQASHLGQHFFKSKPRPAMTLSKLLVAKNNYPRAVLAEKYPHLSDYALFLKGEVYEVTEDELAEADSYEGAPSWYHQIKTQVRYLDGDEVGTVLMYEANEAAEVFKHLEPTFDTNKIEAIADEMLLIPGFNELGAWT